MKKRKKSSKEKKVEKQLIKILSFFVGLIVIFFIASWVFESLNNFEYQGLTFTKEKIGELNFYHYFYYFAGNGGEVNKYNLYLRNDPRYNNVPILAENPIIFNKGSAGKPIAYVTIDTRELTSCKESIAGVATLSGFLSDNGVDVRSGNMNPAEALIYDQNYITCENKKFSNVRVIQMLRAPETKIIVNGSCHTIQIGPECNVFEAVEKYEVQAIIDARDN